MKWYTTNKYTHLHTTRDTETHTVRKIREKKSTGKKVTQNQQQTKKWIKKKVNELLKNAKQTTTTTKNTQKIQDSQLQKKYGVHSKLNLGSQKRNENK